MIWGINYARLCPWVHKNSLCRQYIMLGHYFWDLWFILVRVLGLSHLSSRNLKEWLKWKCLIEIPPQSSGMCLTDYPFQRVTMGQKSKNNNNNYKHNKNRNKQCSSFPLHWTQTCLLGHNDILSHAIASKNVSSDLWECYVLFSFILALGKIFFV